MERQEILERIEEDDKGKRDELVPWKEVEVVPPSESGGSLQVNLSGERYSLTETGAQQFFGKLGIPTNYAKRCPPHLLHQNVDYWLGRIQKEDKSALFRLRDDVRTIRAVLSDRYAVYNNADFVPQLFTAVESLGLVFDQASLSEDLLLLKGHFPKFEVEGPSDPHYVGFTAINSEVGKASVLLAIGLFREVCTNGATVTVASFGMKRKHVGHRGSPYALVNDLRLRTSEVAAQLPSAAESLQNAVIQASNRGVDENLWVRAQHELGKGYVEELRSGLEGDMGSPSVYDFVDRLTRESQKESPERRHLIDNFAGNILVQGQRLAA